MGKNASAKLAYDICELFDVRPALDRSRFRIGTLRARGVPAVLLGVAAIVAAHGAGVALGKAATALPDSLREARALWLAVRGPREMLANA